MQWPLHVFRLQLGHASNTVKIPMFKATVHDKQFKLWLSVNKKKDFSKGKRAIFFCANHFEESDIVKSTKKPFQLAKKNLMPLNVSERKLRTTS